MKYLMVLILLIPLAASADTLMNMDGATCEIPDGFNTAPYDDLYNTKGMSEFCVFPGQEKLVNFLKLIGALQEQADGQCPRSGPDIPECNRLVVSPAIQEFPCYEVKHE